MDDLDRKIKELEMAWSVYHKNRHTRKYPIPDLIQLSKLKQEKEKRDAEL